MTTGRRNDDGRAAGEADGAAGGRGGAGGEAGQKPRAAVGRARESAGGPLLRPLELVETEQGETAGDHPGEGVQRVGDQSLSDTTAIRLNAE